MLRRYSVVGLGKLGSSMLAAIASRGFYVVGVDINEHSVQCINNGVAPILETDVNYYLSHNIDRIRATTSYKDAINDSEVTFVVVPTPSNQDGSFSLDYVSQSFVEIGRALREKKSYHLVVLTSTVLPGSTRHKLIPLLEKHSGLSCGRDFGVCYSPEFVALGSVIRDFLSPDFSLIGEHDTKSGDLMENVYTDILIKQTPCCRMSLENAELTKIALNTFVTTKIVYVNMLSDLCSRIPGGNIDVVSNALGFDKRIGHKSLTGGLGYGGPCFPRDNQALYFIANKLGVNATIAQTTDFMNRQRPLNLLELILPLIANHKNIAVLGLSYKPLSNVIEESQSIYLALDLARRGYHVKAFDPLANEFAKPLFELHQIALANTITDCILDADAILVTTPDPYFLEMPYCLIKKGAFFVDFWRKHANALEKNPDINYIPIGIGPVPSLETIDFIGNSVMIDEC